jgi:hypothetical protein
VVQDSTCGLIRDVSVVSQITNRCVSLCRPLLCVCLMVPFSLVPMRRVAAMHAPWATEIFVTDRYATQFFALSDTRPHCSLQPINSCNPFRAPSFSHSLSPMLPRSQHDLPDNILHLPPSRTTWSTTACSCTCSPQSHSLQATATSTTPTTTL